YHFIADHRHCADGLCALDPPARIDPSRWLPPAVLVLTGLILACSLAPWGGMWTLAISMYFACKWITWWPLRHRSSPAMQLAYLFAWPGMNPAFLDRQPGASPPPRGRWLKPILTALLGATLLLVAAHRIPTTWSLSRAWAGMLGLI